MQPRTVITIDPKHRIVEGVASDGSTIWVSSILDREVLACRRSCRTLAVLPDGLSPLAISWDKGRSRLWVAADCPPGVPGIRACERGSLIGLTLAGGIATRVGPPSGSFHPGDVSASPLGVFVSDSQNGAIYELSRSGSGLSPLVAPGVGRSAQGTALDASGEKLLFADYSEGIGVITLGTLRRVILPRNDGKPLLGIDGLTRCGRIYYGIYNGSSPGALVAITPFDGGLTSHAVSGESTLPDPTQVAYDGKRLLIVADSGWATLGEAGYVRTTGTPILEIPLGADCKPR